MHMSITLTCLAYAHVHERVDHACLQPGHTSLHMPITHAIMRWIKGEQACIPRGGEKKTDEGCTAMSVCPRAEDGVTCDST